MDEVANALGKIASDLMPVFPDDCEKCGFWADTPIGKKMCRAPITDRRLCKLQRIDKAVEELIFSMPRKPDGGAEFAEVRLDKLQELGIAHGMKDF